jgi:uncharacterized repeat protein (TIGR01451 family)
MERSHLGALALSTLLATFAATAAAAPPSAIKLDIAVQKEIAIKDPTGVQKVQLVEPKLVVPGDAVVYRITYTNVGKEPTTAVVVNNKVPEHMTYIPATAEGANTRILFSVDGTDFGPPEALKVRKPDGTERPATAEDIAYIRWLVSSEVQPGGSGTVSYKARLE